MIQATPGARLDYVQVVDYDSLRPLDSLQGTVLVPLAVYFGATRLIDNLLIRIAS
jgi:pantoate--beta-alanine ligase